MTSGVLQLLQPSHADSASLTKRGMWWGDSVRVLWRRNKSGKSRGVEPGEESILTAYI